jgi:hypothetical protein
VKAERLGIFIADLEAAERGADGVAGLLARRRFALTCPAQGAVTAMVALLVSTSKMSLDGLDGAVRLDQDANHGGLGDGLAELGHQDGDGGHLCRMAKSE